MRKYGKLLERTVFDKNEIFDRGEYCELALYNRRSQLIGYAKFDKEDLAVVSKYKWSFNGGYVRTNGKKIVRLHRLVMGNPPSTIFIDHRYGNTLDNRKQQLRRATKRENVLNSRKKAYRKNLLPSSSYKGVYRYRNGKWRAQLRSGKRFCFLGDFAIERHAALMYDFWATYAFGEFAKTNFKVVSHS